MNVGRRMKQCPACKSINDDDWPIRIKGEIKDGGCQLCWESQADENHWEMVVAADKIISIIKGDNDGGTMCRMR